MVRMERVNSFLNALGDCGSQCSTRSIIYPVNLTIAYELPVFVRKKKKTSFIDLEELGQSLP